jgi:outer membrane protein assembly factor BamB
MTGHRTAFLGVTLLLLSTAVACADGPSLPGDGLAGRIAYRRDGSGVFADARPVANWDTAAGRNVLWKIDFPDWGHSLPIVVGDKLFITTEPQWLYCVDAATGRVLWKQESNVFDLVPGEEGQKLKEAWRINWDTRLKMAPLNDKVKAIGKQLAAADGDAKLKAELDKLNAELKPIQDEHGRTWLILNHGYSKFRGAMWGELLGFTTAAPVSDGKFVYVKHGTGVVACYDLAGKRQWMTKFEFDPQATNCCSPLLAGGRVVIHRKKSTAKSGVRGGTYTLCGLDPRSGDVAWETAPLAVPDWGSGTSLALRIGGADVIVTAGGDAVGASDGKVLARRMFGPTVASASGPIAAGDVVIMTDDSDGGKTDRALRAVRLAAGESGAIKVEPLWTRAVSNLPAEAAQVDETGSAPSAGAPTTAAAEPPTASRPAATSQPATIADTRAAIFSTPVCHKGRVYAVEERGLLLVVDAGTGNIIEATNFFPPELRKSKVVVWAPLTIAGNYLFIVELDGRVLVLELEPKLRLQAVTSVPRRAESAPFFVGGRMYLRTQWSLFCIGS